MGGVPRLRRSNCGLAPHGPTANGRRARGRARPMDACRAAGRARWLRATRPNGGKPPGAVARGWAALGPAPATSRRG
eukprot:11186757-Lingulodinium_polyedra.AAC.1